MVCVSCQQRASSPDQLTDTVLKENIPQVGGTDNVILSPDPRGMESRSQPRQVSPPRQGAFWSPWQALLNLRSSGPQVLECSSGWVVGCYPSDPACLLLSRSCLPARGPWARGLMQGLPSTDTCIWTLANTFHLFPKSPEVEFFPHTAPASSRPSVDSSLGFVHAESCHGLMCHLCQRTWDSLTFMEPEAEEGNPLATSTEEEPAVTADH